MNRSIRTLSLLAAALFAVAAHAQYPSKPIRMILPLPPGGAIDGAARILAQPLSQSLGQPVVVDNRAGADGVIAASAVMAAEPDGYTLFFTTATPMAAVPALKKSPPYDPATAFSPVSLVGTLGLFLMVHESVPAKTLAELVAHVRANPGKVNYAIPNSSAMIATAQLKHLEKLDMVGVPYKGDAPAVADLVAGRVQVMFASPGAPMQHLKTGKLRALAALSPARSPLAPEVPTIVEAGVPKLGIVPWVGVFGPAKLPPEIADRLAKEIAAALAKPEVRQQLAQLGAEVRATSPKELGEFHAEQLRQWRATVRDAGIAQE